MRKPRGTWPQVGSSTRRAVRPRGTAINIMCTSSPGGRTRASEAHRRLARDLLRGASRRFLVETSIQGAVLTPAMAEVQCEVYHLGVLCQDECRFTHDVNPPFHTRHVECEVVPACGGWAVRSGPCRCASWRAGVPSVSTRRWALLRSGPDPTPYTRISKPDHQNLESCTLKALSPKLKP